MTSDSTLRLSPEKSLAELTQAVWEQRGGHTDSVPPELVPTFSHLDEVITATAWAADARLEFNQRWSAVKELSQSKFDGVDSFALLTHMAWDDIRPKPSHIKHPLAPLIHAWHTRPAEVSAVRDANGALRGDTIIPRIAMRESGTKADRFRGSTTPRCRAQSYRPSTSPHTLVYLSRVALPPQPHVSSLCRLP